MLVFSGLTDGTPAARFVVSQPEEIGIRVFGTFGGATVALRTRKYTATGVNSWTEFKPALDADPYAGAAYSSTVEFANKVEAMRDQEFGIWITGGTGESIEVWVDGNHVRKVV